MVDRKTIADPTTHYGSARGATRAFIVQRITAALNVVSLAFLAWLVVSLAGADRAAMVTTVANPIVAVLLAVLIASVSIHMRTGMREIIEDYVHDPRLSRLSFTVNDAFCLFIAFAGLLALIKIVFWG